LQRSARELRLTAFDVENRNDRGEHREPGIVSGRRDEHLTDLAEPALMAADADEHPAVRGERLRLPRLERDLECLVECDLGLIGSTVVEEPRRREEPRSPPHVRKWMPNRKGLESL